jgi:hypothetical protein
VKGSAYQLLRRLHGHAAELAGADVPEGLDSISLVPVLSGRSGDQERHEYLYWESYERGSAQAHVPDPPGGFHEGTRWA